MTAYRFVFAGLLSVAALVPQMAAAQLATRAASADDLAIARMESAMTVKRWGDGVSLADRALIGCIGGEQGNDAPGAQTKISNTCAFPLVVAGTMGALTNGQCAGQAAIAERILEAGAAVASAKIAGELPCLVEVTRLGVSATAQNRPETIDAAVAVIVKRIMRGSTEVFNHSGNAVAKPWTLHRVVGGMTMTQRCHSSFAVPELLSGEGEGLGTPAKAMGVDWTTVSIVRVYQNGVTFIDAWMQPGEIGVFLTPTEAEAAQMAAAFETLVLRC